MWGTNFSLNFLQNFWIWGHAAWLFCFRAGVIYPHTLKRNGEETIVHSPVRTQLYMHLPPFAALVWWMLETAIILYWTVTKCYTGSQLTDLCVHNNDPLDQLNHHYLLKEDFAPLSSSELNNPSYHFFWTPSMKCLRRHGIHIISYNQKYLSFTWDVITFHVNITAWVN